MRKDLKITSRPLKLSLQYKNEYTFNSFIIHLRDSTLLQTWNINVVYVDTFVPSATEYPHGANIFFMVTQNQLGRQITIMFWN